MIFTILTNCGKLGNTTMTKIILKIQKSQRYIPDGKMSNFKKMIQFRNKSLLITYEILLFMNRVAVVQSITRFIIFGITTNL